MNTLLLTSSFWLNRCCTPAPTHLSFKNASCVLKTNYFPSQVAPAVLYYGSFLLSSTHFRSIWQTGERTLLISDQIQCSRHEQAWQQSNSHKLERQKSIWGISSRSLSHKLAGKVVENSSDRCLPVGSINGTNNVAICFLLPTLLVLEKTMLKNELHLTL